MIRSWSGCADQPAPAGPEQLVDLVGALPVVLGLIEHREQDVELVQGVGQTDDARQPSRT